VTICKHYDLEPETLRYKIEAANYRPSATSSQIVPITMDTLSAVRTQLKQDMTKDMKKAQVKVGGLNTAKVDLKKLNPTMGGRSFSNIALQKSVLPIKQESQGDPMNWSSISTSSSNVTFVGPRTDLEARKKRACEQIMSVSQEAFVDSHMFLFRSLYV